MKTILTALSLTLAGVAVLYPGGTSPAAPEAPLFEPEPWAGQAVIPLDKCRLELLKSRVIVVGASQSGVLEFVEPGEVGKEVQADNAVAKIRDRVIQERLKAAQQRVESDVEIKYAQKSNEVAVAKYERAKTIRSYSDAEMMELKLDMEKTELQIEKARVDRTLQGLERGEIAAEIETYTMTTPISGEVSEVMKQRGESVRQGDDIMQITDLSQVRAIGHVPTKFQRQITKGQRVKVRLLSPSPGEERPFAQIFDGKITYIAPRVSVVTQTFEVYATVENQRDENGNFILKQGMESEMAIVLDGPAPRAASQPRSRR